MLELQLSQESLLAWYSQDPVKKSILANAKDREVAVKFGSGGFGKRPDTLKYPDDVIEFVKQGATSFHISEEHWSNPLQITPNLRRPDLDKLRSGWDLVLDIDCDLLEYSKIAAHLILQALIYHNIDSFSVKFSGNHGFHIVVPFSSFPEKISTILKKNQLTKDQFPEGPRRIALYLKDFIRDSLEREILKLDDIAKIVKKSGKTFTDLVTDGKFDPYAILDIDTILISSRHLYRSVYSFNEKSGLVSIPLDPKKILSFKKEDANPKNLKPVFCDPASPTEKPYQAEKLIIQAFDHKPKEDKPKESDIKEFQNFHEAIPESLFPPCIQNIFQGLEDGKKRSLFILTNFLTSCGWNYDMIGKRIKTWNQKNKDLLRETIIVGQLRYHKQQKKRILPPNCQNVLYYTDLRVCNPDNLCQRIKNPVNYAVRKARALQNNKVKPFKNPNNHKLSKNPHNPQSL